jgi:hypothetical protein
VDFLGAYVFQYRFSCSRLYIGALSYKSDPYKKGGRHVRAAPYTPLKFSIKGLRAYSRKINY